MKYLVILNDPLYGTERSYNGLRPAIRLAKTSGTEIRLFLMADAAAGHAVRPKRCNAAQSPSRIHLYRVSVGSLSCAGRMVLMK